MYKVGEEITIKDARVFVHGLRAEAWHAEGKMYEYKTLPHWVSLYPTVSKMAVCQYSWSKSGE